jgi:hypothetical protein
MSKRLDNIVSNLVYQVIRATGSYDYLDSTCQKHLFAERRLITLRRKITSYKRRIEFRNGTTSFPSPLSVEMDLDHCISSLRSSLEHLAQIINSVAPLSLQPTGLGKDTVSLQNVVNAINNNSKFKNNQYLSKLSDFLRNEMNKDWYKELHKFRIEMYHHKSPDILNPRTEPNQMDELFLIPQDVAISAKTKKDREICSFCQNRVNDIEDVLYNSFCLISKYLPQPDF